MTGYLIILAMMVCTVLLLWDATKPYKPLPNVVRLETTLSLRSLGSLTHNTDKALHLAVKRVEALRWMRYNNIRRFK